MASDDMNFGKLSKAYDSARHAYPQGVMDSIFSNIDASAKVLDIGCGTGIATRQLLQRNTDVTGCDIDSKMIQTANTYGNSINYYIAPTEKMPFEDAGFDAITSFGAFHWFCDVKSISEIRRVLRKGGFFIVINKRLLIALKLFEMQY